MKHMLRMLAAAALAGGIMVAGEPGEVVSVDMRERPLAEVLEAVGKATGHRFEYAPGTVEGKKISFVKSGMPDDVLAAFGAALDVTQSIALVSGKDGARRLLPYKKSTRVAPKPATRSRRLTVEVVEGTVLLTGGQGSVTVRAGERSWVNSGALPAAPVPFDTASVAPWRVPEASAASTGLQASVPLPEVRFQLTGYTESGDPIIEYEMNGARFKLDFGTLDIPEEERRKIVIEDGELLLPFTLRFKIDKSNK
jgi:hypothetical protein